MHITECLHFALNQIDRFLGNKFYGGFDAEVYFFLDLSIELDQIILQINAELTNLRLKHHLVEV